jgi:hypothetical protein
MALPRFPTANESKAAEEIGAPGTKRLADFGGLQRSCQAWVGTISSAKPKVPVGEMCSI